MMKTDLQKAVILRDNFILTTSEKQSIAVEITQAINKYNCYCFDYLDGNLMPIDVFESGFSDVDFEDIEIYEHNNIYAIPDNFYSKNTYLNKHYDCLELLNLCDNQSYSIEHITAFNRYLFDFDFDNKVSIDTAINDIVNICIKYELPCRVVFTGNRGLHIVFFSNHTEKLNKYKLVWFSLYTKLCKYIPNLYTNYIDLHTDRPNVYTRKPNAIRPDTNKNQTLLYDNLYFAPIAIHQARKNNVFIPTTTRIKEYEKTSSNFSLAGLYNNTKRIELIQFVDGTAPIGTRTMTALIAIGMIRKAMQANNCSKNEISFLINDLLDKYCAKTGAMKQEFSTFLMSLS